MHVLVDYDNAPVYRNQPVRLISDVVGLLTALPVRTANFHFRLYGGWDTFGGVATPLAQMVSAQLQGALPYALPPIAPGNLPTIVTAELVRDSLWIPTVSLVDTFRPRSPGQRVRGVVPAGCPTNTQATPCQLHTVLAVLNTPQCSATCAIHPHDAVAKDEQKQVDTSIVADLINLAFLSSEDLTVVTTDDDVWPGIFAAVAMGKPVIHVDTRTPSACSLGYEAAVLARGHAYQRTHI